jgi:hypothetical protein
MRESYGLRIIATAAALLLCCGSANAELVSIDLVPGSGDQLLLHDTQTGLDWLDVTQTVNQNYDDVRTGIWYQLGFRHATHDQLEALFTNAGTPDDGFDITVTYPNETKALIGQLGLTFEASGRESTYGLAGTDFLGQLVTLSTHPIGQTFSALLGKLDVLLPFPTIGRPAFGEAHFTGGHPFSDEASPNYGSFLVRPHLWPPRDLFLHGGGGQANPPSLTIDAAAPTAATAKFKDSASVNFSGGNPWREVGTWSALPTTTGSSLMLADLRVWLGLKNSDDQGTSFDIRAEAYKAGELMTSGLVRCITGIVRNPGSAQAVTVSFDPVPPVDFDGAGDVLMVRVLARIGTNPDDTKCAGHNGAAGLRLYFDGVNQASQFGATLP